MRPTTEKRIRKLLEHLEALDARCADPTEASICAIARDAIMDEIGRLARAHGLAVQRRGRMLEAVSMVG